MPRDLTLLAAVSGRRTANHAASRRGAFSLVELLVVIGVIAVVLSILIPVVSKARAASRSVNCLAHLRQLNVAFHLFAERHGSKLPDPTITKVSWESSLLPFVNKTMYECPADGELFPSLGSSYDWRDTPDPLTTLAGEDIFTPNRSSLVLVFEALPSWHSKTKINAGRLDGSAIEMEYEECLFDLGKPNKLP